MAVIPVCNTCAHLHAYNHTISSLDILVRKEVEMECTYSPVRSHMLSHSITNLIVSGRSLLQHTFHRSKVNSGIPALEWMKWHDDYVCVCVLIFPDEYICNNYTDKIQMCVGCVFLFFTSLLSLCVRMANEIRERQKKRNKEETQKIK